jgi:hypothetical protein
MEELKRLLSFVDVLEPLSDEELGALAARCTGGPALLLIGEVFAAISTKAVDISVESRHYRTS